MFWCCWKLLTTLKKGQTFESKKVSTFMFHNSWVFVFKAFPAILVPRTLILLASARHGSRALARTSITRRRSKSHTFVTVGNPFRWCCSESLKPLVWGVPASTVAFDLQRLSEGSKLRGRECCALECALLVVSLVVSNAHACENYT